jgi:hypothetical protein
VRVKVKKVLDLGWGLEWGYWLMKQSGRVWAMMMGLGWLDKLEWAHMGPGYIELLCNSIHYLLYSEKWMCLR